MSEPADLHGEPTADGVSLSATVYRRLHELAEGQLRRGPSPSLQPTLLVHEAWLRIAGLDAVRARQRGEFFALASKAMRSVVVDHARRALAGKRRGARSELDPDAIGDPRAMSADDLVALDDALQRLAGLDAELVQIVELLFFAGASTAEAAERLGVSTRTVERRWRLARAWLRHELHGGDDGGCTR